MRICVFCGSGSGKNPAYSQAARDLGRSLAEMDLELVYGGADVGLMGEVANAALEEGGQVIGIIPDVLVERELAHHGVSELQVVSSMHERKSRMTELSDVFITLPGGSGSMDEFFELLTLQQIGYTDKPVVLWNLLGYYDSLLLQMDRFVSDGFLREAHRSRLHVADDLPSLLELLRNLAEGESGLVEEAGA